MTGIPETITKSISDNQRFVLLTHIHPDGDALGSMFGLADILDDLGKDVFCFVEEPVSQLYAFLPGAGRASSDLDALHDFVRQAHDKTAVIALDSGCVWGNRLTAIRLDEPGVPAWSVPAVNLPPPPT